MKTKDLRKKHKKNKTNNKKTYWLWAKAWQALSLKKIQPSQRQTQCIKVLILYLQDLMLVNLIRRALFRKVMDSLSFENFLYIDVWKVLWKTLQKIGVWKVRSVLVLYVTNIEQDFTCKWNKNNS